MNTRLIMAICCLICSAIAWAQNIKRPDSYNYQRGIEAIQEEKMGDALEYFNKDIGENPKNTDLAIIAGAGSRSWPVTWKVVWRT